MIWRRRRRLLAGIGLSIVIAAFAACGGSDDDAPPGATVTRTPAGTVIATAILRTAVASPTPTGTPPTPTPRPTATPTPVNRPPTFTWLLREHSGAGVVTVRMETGAPTTARLLVVGKPGESPGIEPQTDTSRGVAQVLSTALPPDTFVEVELKDDKGRTTIGELEGGSVLGNQYWGRGESAPKITFEAKGRAIVTWSNLRDVDDPRRPASVQLFTRPAGCTTAQACRYVPGDVFGADKVSTKGTAESHAIGLTFEAREDLDYLVLIRSAELIVAEGRGLQRFFQIEVKAAEVIR